MNVDDVSLADAGRAFVSFIAPIIVSRSSLSSKRTKSVWVRFCRISEMFANRPTNYMHGVSTDVRTTHAGLITKHVAAENEVRWR